ncbi:hypothetical protein KIH74_00205 [Kineosporia sp. J2-2]|uniref:Uncharacterized protein n=1 Tax=Kineosporia corallincola TaxID=2835133 RepID=A0ABS5TB11_9ACTN|nr:hypothetical protein [Kineosporia corallincola]MBT0767323.1 hypothetical protein [Kineosporia corallincola]
MHEQAALKGERPARPAAEQWLGRIAIDLRNARDWSIGTLELEFQLNAVTAWFGSRVLAVMDRDQLRDWIIHPRGTRLPVDDLIWSAQYGSTYVAIGLGSEYRLSDASVRELTAVV